MKNSQTNHPFHKEFFIILLPLFFVFHGYVENFHAVGEWPASVLFLKYAIASVLLSFIFYLVLKNRSKAAFLAFSLLTINFFFGALHDWLKQASGLSFISTYSFLLPFVLGLATFLFFLVKSSGADFQKAAFFLNLLLITLLFIDVVSLLGKPGEKNNAAVAAQKISCDTCQKPDVYLIVADEYAGRQELKDLFNFDNSGFEQQLKNRGFHVVNNSKSNYNYTPFSMASLLHLNYLDLQSNTVDKKNLNLSYNILNNPTLLRYYKDAGYTVKNFSLFKLDGIPPLTEQGMLVSGTGLITGQTLLNRVKRDLGYHLVTTFKFKAATRNVTYEAYRDNQMLIKKLEQESAEDSPKPKFVYTHLLMPHYPYYQNRNGAFHQLDSIVEGKQTKMDYYLEYLQFSNKAFLKLIDQILKNTRSEAIIIFMSDHGFREYPTSIDRKYQFTNINAIFLPGKDYSNFYEGMSNVNLFRMLLNKQFNTSLPALKDSTIFLEGM